MLFCKHYFSLPNTFMRKGKDLLTGSGSVPLSNGTVSGSPKHPVPDPDPQHCTPLYKNLNDCYLTWLLSCKTCFIFWNRVMLGFNYGPKPVFLINFCRQFQTFGIRLRPLKYPRLEIKITGRSVPCLFSDRCETHFRTEKTDRKPVMPTAGLGR
jgi:hypothetical protein